MDKFLNKVGDYDYDLKNDIFFFKVKDREYAYSIELNNLVIDFDEEDFIVGLQVFNASTFFDISKENLHRVKNFKMQSKIKNGLIQINLTFGMIIRNQKTEYKPIIFERVTQKIPNSELLCIA